MRAADAVQGYLIASLAENKSPKTLAMIEWHAHKFFAALPVGPDTELECITPTHVRAFLASESKRGLSPHSVHAHYKVLAPFFRWAVTERLIPCSPLANLKPPKLPALLPKVLNVQQVETLLKQLRKQANTPSARRNLVIISTLLGTGLRAAELCALELSDLNLDAQFLIVRRGKGGKDRLVPLRPALLKLLWRYVHQWRDALNPVSPVVFPSRSGLPLPALSLEQLCARHLASAGIKGRTHILRHTFATFYIQGGGDLKRLQMILGHSSVLITERYVHLSTRDVLPQTGPAPLDKLGL